MVSEQKRTVATVIYLNVSFSSWCFRFKLSKDLSIVEINYFFSSGAFLFYYQSLHTPLDHFLAGLS